MTRSAERIYETARSFNPAKYAVLLPKSGPVTKGTRQFIDVAHAPIEDERIRGPGASCWFDSGVCAGQRPRHRQKISDTEGTPPASRCVSAKAVTSSIAGRAFARLGSSSPGNPRENPSRPTSL